MNKLNTRRFNKILCLIDDNNYFDFESFTEAVLAEFKIIKQITIDNMVDFLVFDLSISCDADLTKLSQGKLSCIINGINKILSEGEENE